jgi:hypothetical protein
MKNLIKYFSYLMVKSRVFWVCILFTEILIAALIIPKLSLHPETDIGGSFDSWAMLGFMYAFIAVSSYTTGALFSQKAISDTVSTGFSRRQVYLAKTIVNAAFCSVLLIINLLTFYLAVFGFNSEANLIIFDDLPAKLITTFFMNMFYIVLFTSFSFIAKSPIGSVLCGWLVGVVGTNFAVMGLSYLFGLQNNGLLYNIFYFFNNWFFRVTYYRDNINEFIFSVSGIYLILTAVFYFLGERNFRKADLK